MNTLMVFFSNEVALFLYGIMLTTITKSGEPEADSSLISRIRQHIKNFSGSKYLTLETPDT